MRSRAKLRFIRDGGTNWYCIRRQQIALLIRIVGLQGARKYLQFGLGLEMARNLIANYSLILRRPSNILQIFFKRLNWNLIAFLPSYVAIYRVSLDSDRVDCDDINSFLLFLAIEVRQLFGESPQHSPKRHRFDEVP